MVDESKLVHHRSPHNPRNNELIWVQPLVYTGWRTMGDFFLTHTDEGRAYLRRLFYLNILWIIIIAFLTIVFMVDLTILIIAAALLASASLIYALYFVIKNPPIE